MNQNNDNENITNRAQEEQLEASTSSSNIDSQHVSSDAHEDTYNYSEQILASQSTSCHHDMRKSHHSDAEKKKLISRLNRIEGQIRGIKAMIEKDTYCDDVLTQIAAAQSALGSTAKLLLEAHMKSCIVERIEAGEHEVVDELLITVAKLMK